MLVAEDGAPGPAIVHTLAVSDLRQQGLGAELSTARRSVDAGTADLHQRYHRRAEGRDARSRQPRCDGRHGMPSARYRACRSVAADPAAVSRQRHRGECADAAAGRRECRHRRAVR